MYLSIRRAIKQIVVIIGAYHFCHQVQKFSIILLSKLTPYADEIIVNCQCGFRRNRLNTDHIYRIREILEKITGIQRNSASAVNKKIQLDATVRRHLFIAKSLYMFQAPLRPSSGVLKTVTATSGIGHNIGAGAS
jgi:hypothetical protein